MGESGGTKHKVNCGSNLLAAPHTVGKGEEVKMQPEPRTTAVWHLIYPAAGREAPRKKENSQAVLVKHLEKNVNR